MKLNYTDKNGLLRLSRSLKETTNVLVRARFYDNLDSTLGNMLNVKDTQGNKTALGVNTLREPWGASNYYFRYDQGDEVHFFDSQVPRTRGWHTFEFIVLPSGTYAKIDGLLLTNPYGPKNWYHQLPGEIEIKKNPRQTSLSEVNIIGTWGLLGESYYDDIEVILPPKTKEEVILAVNDWFLQYYQNSNLAPFFNSGETTKETPYLLRPENHNAAISLFRTSLAHGFKYLTDQDPADLARAKGILEETLSLLTDEHWAEMEPWRSLPVATDQLILASQVIWDHLSAQTQNEIISRVIVGTNKFLEPQPGLERSPGSCYGEACGGWDFEGKCCRAYDTSAEDNAWNAAFLAIAYNFLSHYRPNYEKLSEIGSKARCYAYHSITTSENDRFGTDACQIDTQTICDETTPVVGCTCQYNQEKNCFFGKDNPEQCYEECAREGYPRDGNNCCDAFTPAGSTKTCQPWDIVNHGLMPNPNYTMATIGSLARGAIYYELFGQPVPPEFRHNVASLWDYYWNRAGVIDKDTFFYIKNAERFQGGFNMVSPMVMYFIEKTNPEVFTPSQQLNVLQKKYLFQYGTPLYYHQSAPVNPMKNYYDWVQESNIVQNYLIRLLVDYQLISQPTLPANPTQPLVTQTLSPTQIPVTTATPNPTAIPTKPAPVGEINLIERAPHFYWENSRGQQPWGGTAENPELGWAKSPAFSLVLEDGHIYNPEKVIYLHPQWIKDGIIKATTAVGLPEANKITLKGKVGILHWANSGGVRFEIRTIDPQNPNVFPILWNKKIYLDGRLDNIEIDLSHHRGKRFPLIFTLFAEGSPNYDHVGLVEFKIATD